MIGAEHDVIGTDILDDPGQHHRVEHRRVVVEPVDELAGRHRRGARDILAVPTHVHPAPERWHTTSTVREAQVEREALQYPAERQPGHRNRRLHRVPDQLGHPEVLQPGAGRHPAGVQEGEGAALGEQRPEVVVHRIVEILAAALATDGDTRQSEVVQHPPGLVGDTGPAERHVPQPEQPIRRLRDVLGQLVIALGDDAGGKGLVVGRGAEQERRQ